MLVVDEKAAGTDGGNSTSGSWMTRTLNTVKFNTISGASLSRNQVTLPAGTYKITASAPVYQALQHIIRVYNVTDSATAISGLSDYAYSAAMHGRAYRLHHDRRNEGRASRASGNRWLRRQRIGRGCSYGCVGNVRCDGNHEGTVTARRTTQRCRPSHFGLTSRAPNTLLNRTACLPFTITWSARVMGDVPA